MMTLVWDQVNEVNDRMIFFIIYFQFCSFSSDQLGYRREAHIRRDAAGHDASLHPNVALFSKSQAPRVLNDPVWDPRFCNQNTWYEDQWGVRISNKNQLHENDIQIIVIITIIIFICSFIILTLYEIISHLQDLLNHIERPVVVVVVELNNLCITAPCVHTFAHNALSPY